MNELVFILNTTRDDFVDWFYEKTNWNPDPDIRQKIKKASSHYGAERRLSKIYAKKIDLSPRDVSHLHLQFCDESLYPGAILDFYSLPVDDTRLEVTASYTGDNGLVAFSEVLRTIAQTYHEAEGVINNYIVSKLPDGEPNPATQQVEPEAGRETEVKMTQIKIPIDIIDASTQTFYFPQVKFTRVARTSALIDFISKHDELGNLGFIQLRKINENCTDISYFHPPKPVIYDRPIALEQMKQGKIQINSDIHSMIDGAFLAPLQKNISAEFAELLEEIIKGNQSYVTTKDKIIDAIYLGNFDESFLRLLYHYAYNDDLGSGLKMVLQGMWQDEKKDNQTFPEYLEIKKNLALSINLLDIKNVNDLLLEKLYKVKVEVNQQVINSHWKRIQQEQKEGTEREPGAGHQENRLYYEKGGRPGLDPQELEYRLSKAREAEQIKKNNPIKTWKEIAKDITWRYSVKLLEDARYRLKRMEKNP